MPHNKETPATQYNTNKFASTKRHGSHQAPLGVTLAIANDTSKEPEIQSPGVYYHLKPFIVASTFLGLLPLSTSLFHCRKSSKITFSWLSWPTFLTIIILISMVIMSVITSIYYLTVPIPHQQWGIEAVAIHPRKMIFYIMNTAVLVLSLQLARQMPDLIRHWDEAVVVLQKSMYKFYTPIHMSRRHVSFTASFFTILAFAEHALYDLSVGTCLANGQEVNDFLRCYYIGTPYINNYFKYNETLVILVVIVEKFGMLAWNFPSLLVILFSMSLNANFRVISRLVHEKVIENDNYRKVSEWKEIREDHLALCRLLRYVDKTISPLILVAFFGNIYWNCVNAFYSLRPKARIGLEILYFWTSFLLLAVRLGSVSHAGTLLYEQANKPLKYLFYCPPKYYNDEVIRFQTHINGQTLGFTGMKFFVVNRQLLLTIISLILTYELILLDAQ